MKFIIPIILILISIGGFYLLINPLYDDISYSRSEVSLFEDSIENQKSLEKEREKLIGVKSSISDKNLDRLNKLLPNSIDNIRLILEIEDMARPYGMILKDIKYDDAKDIKQDGPVEAGRNIDLDLRNKEYGVLNFSFSVEGSYFNFLNFVSDLENNLRVLDIVSVEFSSGSSSLGAVENKVKNNSDIYKYNLKIKTYWLKQI